jgi:hypothetical protein
MKFMTPNLTRNSERGDTGAMKKKPRVTFKMKRIAEGDWQIAAECEGTETKFITGLKNKSEVDEWLNGTRRIEWLRSQGYAK